MTLTSVYGLLFCLAFSANGIRPVISDADLRCSVFEPFRIAPENARYYIGGPFALHAQDCRTIQPEAIQELVAVQWSLSHWNQNPENTDSKIAMFAGDFCSKEREAVSQTVRFLQDTGYFQPSECAPTEQQAIPLGVISPSNQEHTAAIADTLKTFGLPSVAYTASAAAALRKNKQTALVFSTAPSLSNYLQLAISLLKSLDANHTVLVTNTKHLSLVASLKSSLSRAGIVVERVLNVDDKHDVAASLVADASRVALTLLDKASVQELFLFKSGGAVIKKIWLMLPPEDESLSAADLDLIAAYTTRAVVILLQQRLIEMPAFRDYFLDILRNNYHSFSLLAGYMRQVYNCSTSAVQQLSQLSSGLRRCSEVSADELLRSFVQAPTIQASVLATYTLAALGKQMSTNGGELTNSVRRRAAENQTGAEPNFAPPPLKYVFSRADPPPLRGFPLNFNADGEIQSIVLEAVQVYSDGLRVTKVNKVAEYVVGSTPQVYAGSIMWPNGLVISSVCAAADPNCAICSDVAASSHRQILHAPGDFYVMGIFSMRDAAEPNGLMKGAETACGAPKKKLDAISLPLSFVYALETIKQRQKQRNLLPNVDIGLLLSDTCDRSINALLDTMKAETSCFNIRRSPAAGDADDVTIRPGNILAYVSGDARSTEAAAQIFAASGIRKPVFTTTATGGHQVSATAVISLSPDAAAEAQATVNLLRHFGWDFVSVILSPRDDSSMARFETFRAVAASHAICVSDTVTVDRSAAAELIMPANRVALAYTTGEDLTFFLRNHRSLFAHEEVVYIVAGDQRLPVDESGSGTGSGNQLEPGPYGFLTLRPRLQRDADDVGDFLSAVSPEQFTEPWFLEFWETHFECALPNRSSVASFKNVPCADSLRLSTAGLGQTLKEKQLVLALEELIFILDDIYRKHCPELKGLCTEFYAEYAKELSSRLRAKTLQQNQFMLYNYRHTPSAAQYVEIGNWSEAGGLQLFDKFQWFRVANQSSGDHVMPESSCKMSTCRCTADQRFFSRPFDNADDFAAAADADVRASKNVENPSSIAVYTEWHSRTWAYIFLGINTFLLLAAICVLVLVVYKLCVGVVKGNQSLGICLLCGCILLYLTAYFFIFDPCDVFCRLRYFMHSFSYALCFGVMIAKAIQLRNAETLGFQGYISYWNYWLLLLFIVGVQVALNMQWAIAKQPIIVSLVSDTVDGAVIKACNWSTDEFLISHVYIVFLLGLLLFLSALTRNVKRNYKETKWLLYTALLCLPVWVTWMIAYDVIPAHFRDTVVVMELIVCATVIVCFMFGPKLYILLSYKSPLCSSGGTGGAGEHGIKMEPGKEAPDQGRGLRCLKTSVASKMSSDSCSGTTTDSSDSAVYVSHNGNATAVRNAFAANQQPIYRTNPIFSRAPTTGPV